MRWRSRLRSRVLRRKLTDDRVWKHLDFVRSVRPFHLIVLEHQPRFNTGTARPISKTRLPARSRVETNASLLDDFPDEPPTPGVASPGLASERTQQQSAISRVVSSCLRLRRLSEHISSSENKNTHSDKDRMWSLAQVVAKRLLLEKTSKSKEEEAPWWVSHYIETPDDIGHAPVRKKTVKKIPEKKKKDPVIVSVPERNVVVSDVIVPERHVVIPEEILPKNDVVFSPKDIAGAPTEEGVDTTSKKPRKKKKNNNNEDDLISQLWHIFSHYAMRRYPKDVDHISDAMALEFLRDCKFLRNSTGRKHSTGLTAAQARVLFRSIRSSRKKNRYYDSVISHKNSKMGAHMMFTDFLRLLGCLADLCSKQVCARPCSHCCAANVRDNITDQILLHACMAMSRSEDGTICNVDSKVHEELEQVLRFLHRHVFPNASSRSRSKILGQNATERGIIIEETRNTLPIVLQAALAPLFTKFCKFENSFFAVLHTGGYYLSPKDSSNINSKRTMFWPQFLALCEHVRIIPALHVRDVADAFLSASKRKYHVTKKTQISEMSQVFVTHELTYSSFLLALYHLGITLRLRDEGMSDDLIRNSSKYVQKMPMHSRLSVLIDVLMTTATTEIGSAAFKFSDEGLSIERRTEVLEHVVSRARRRSLYMC